MADRTFVSSTTGSYVADGTPIGAGLDDFDFLVEAESDADMWAELQSAGGSVHAQAITISGHNYVGHNDTGP